ncbi:hypothetical protein, conserved [Eimeria maxima]|uniref:Transmembrane protein n=1 Tax=Eimeria maxima TaxID=5804 RepID=U6M8P2_EIMMA|nr:hypothetical protein, conserved [Eimeria maxima]CDJ59443.1 hypothetical protein, conserved [Eimeria maxima]
MLTFVMSFLLIVLPAAATLESQLLAALPNSAAAACSAAGDGSSNCSANVRSDDYPRTLREIEAYVALLEGKLEERLEKHEQQQWEQQRKLFVLLAVSICLAVVFIVALAACKVYVQSLQNQMQCSFQGEEQRGIQNSSVSGMHTPSVGGTPKKPSLPRSHSKLSSTEVPGDPPKERWSNSWWIEDTYPTATNGKALRDELGDDQDVCLHPSSEDVAGRARAIEDVREAAGLSPELQQQQKQLEARCSLLFERLHEITDASRAFCSSSSDTEKESTTDPATVGEAGGAHGKIAAADAPSGDTVCLGREGRPTPQSGRQRGKRQLVADPARLEEQRELLKQLQQLFREIDEAFISNKPAHVSVMIRCCNALLQADGLAVLKACADCQPLHKEAQSIIEIVVPCIWAT